MIIENENIDNEIEIERLTLKNNEKAIAKLEGAIKDLDIKNNNDIKGIEDKIFFYLPLCPNVKQILFINNNKKIFPKQYKGIYHTFYLKNNIFNENKYEEHKLKSIDSYYYKFSQSTTNDNYLIMYLKKNAIDSKDYLKSIINALHIKKNNDIKDIYGNDINDKNIKKKYGFYSDINRTNMQKKISIFKIIIIDLEFPNLKEIIKDIKSNNNDNESINYKEITDKNKNRKNNKKVEFSALSGLRPKKTLIIYEIEDRDLEGDNIKKMLNI